MKKFHGKTVLLLLAFTALAILLSRFLSFYISSSLRLSFEYFPIILTGICFGPLAGAVVGGLTDFIGSTLLAKEGFFPLLIVGPILAGYIAGYTAKYMFTGKEKYWKYAVLSIIVDLLCNLTWGSYALSLQKEQPFVNLLISRAPLKLGIAAVDTFLVTTAFRALQPLIYGRPAMAAAEVEEASE